MKFLEKTNMGPEIIALILIGVGGCIGKLLAFYITSRDGFWIKEGENQKCP